MSSLRRRLLKAIPLAAVASIAFARRPDELSLGIVPLNSAIALLNTHQPIRLHVAEALGQPVGMYTAPDFRSFLLDIIGARHDILIAPPHFALIASEGGYVPLVTYSSAVELIAIVRTDSDIDSLAGLACRTIAVSSRLAFATQAGEKAMLDLGLSEPGHYRMQEYATAGAAMTAVALGKADACFSATHALRQMPDDVRVRLASIPLSYWTINIVMLAHSRLGEGVISGIRAALATFPGSVEGRAFFERTGFGGFRPVDRAELEGVRSLARLTVMRAGLEGVLPQ